MREETLQEKKKRLQEHIDTYWKNQVSKRERLKSKVDRWYALYEKLLQHERFLKLAEPVTEKTQFRASEYYMRYDCVHVFPEVILKDKEGNDLINGNPMRIPYDENIETVLPYRGKIVENIFGIPVKSLTTIKNDLNKKDHRSQVEEAERMRLNQEESIYPIDYFRYNAPLSEAPSFKRDDFLFYFPMEKALSFMYHEVKFEPIVKGVDWLLNEAHKLPFAKFSPIKFEELGATGSASFGDEEDKVDFDIAFIGSPELLINIRDFIIEGTRQGNFRPIMSNFKHRIRVENRFVFIDCINKNILFCPFFILKNLKDDPTYQAYIRPIKRFEYVEGLVCEDKFNMISPSTVKIKELIEIRPDNFKLPSEEIDLILMHGCHRGQFYKNNWLRIFRPVLAEVTTIEGKVYPALLSTDWYDVDLASW